MLVLTRKAGESIVIGNDVVITVLEVRGGQIRIGIDAPRDIAVHRAEIYRQVMEANQAAVRSERDSPILRTTAESLTRLRSQPDSRRGDPDAS